MKDLLARLAYRLPMMDKGYQGKNTIGNIKSIIRVIVSTGLYYSGMVNLFRFINQRLQREGVINILAYHNIGNGRYLDLDIPEEIFEEQISFLIQHNYNIISLEEAIRLLQSEEPIPLNSIVITFDDGYKSMYTSVLPLVKKYKIPVTIFLTVGPIERQFPLFVDALIHALNHTDKKSIDLSFCGLKKCSIKSPLSKERAIYEINEYSKNQRNGDKKRLLEFIFKELEVDITSRELKDKMLSWDEIKEMRENGISFGAHTISHPVLSMVPFKDAMHEIIQSKKVINEKIGDDISLFAYPFGSFDSFNNNIVQLIKKNGFSCACTLIRGSNKKMDNLFSLKRDMVTSGIPFKPLAIFSKAVFATQLSGIVNFLLLRSQRY